MSSNKKKYTIIIPAHNRPGHLKRLLDYLLSFNLNIIVADSSNQKFRYLDEYMDKIIYKFYPKLDLASKLFKILYLIETPYVVMCADDDFLVPNSIDKIIDFLEKNTNYNSGQGIYLDFTCEKDEVHYSLRYKKTIGIDLNSDKPSQRVFDLQSTYFQYYYAVFRKETFIEGINSVIEKDVSQIKNLCLLESYISIYTAIKGKHIILPILYSVRENIKNSAASFTDNIFDIVRKKNYRCEYSNYLKLLSENLAAEEELSVIKAKSIIEYSVKIYIKKEFSNYSGISGELKYVLANILKKLKIKRFFFRNKKISIIPSFFTNFEYQELGYIESYIKKYDNLCMLDLRNK